MTGTWDASIKQLYFADKGTLFTARTITIGQEYDIVADIEIGQSLNSFPTENRLIVVVVDAITNTVVQTRTITINLPGGPGQHRQQVPVTFGPLAGVQDGHVLRAVGSFRVKSGLNVDHDTKDAEPTFAVA
ncbi:hypothetical protein ACFCX4_24305 [Kitasatospora sp. NPDC056327]|uniref:hypothetical protein n=1 Tax=Kitasatospora sp. NPDC056327 TaxID=3345785 RepID=UPI0035E268A7